jgi:hypothetical protein
MRSGPEAGEASYNQYSVLSTQYLSYSLFLLLALSVPAPAADDAEQAAGKLITPATQRSIDRGLKWLVAGQREDGSFGSGQLRGNAAVSALAGMAMMCEGSMPGRGRYGAQLNRCIDYLLQCAQPSGFITGPDNSSGPMYGHGLATMFLAECYGMSHRPELREKLTRAVSLIVNCQNQQGGWRYQPVRDQADVSVTVCQIMALRAARNAGLFVPNATVDRAIGYVKRSQNPDGGFMYLIQGGVSAFPRSAAAVTALYSAGIYKGPEISKGLDYLMQFLPNGAVANREGYYYYGQYYAAQAFWQAGGKRFGRWYAAVRDDLVGRQRDDGSWSDPIGNECATAMALIALQMPNNYLPVMQR